MLQCHKTFATRYRASIFTCNPISDDVSDEVGLVTVATFFFATRSPVSSPVRFS
jgi:hypothetical protein